MIQIKKPKYEHDNYCACCRKPFDDSMEISFSNENYNDSILVVLCGKCRRELMEALSKAETNRPEIPDSWIPVSERLPEEKDAGILKKLGTNKKSDYVIATVEVKGERMTVTACTYDGAWDWNMKYAFPDYEIIAWMPLPEPFEGEQH